MNDEYSAKLAMAARKLFEGAANQNRLSQNPLPFAIRLWNGEQVSFAPAGEKVFELEIASPQALRRILLRPNLATFAELYASGELNTGNTPPLELVQNIDHVALRASLKKISKWRVLKNAMPILLARSAPGRVQSPGKGLAFEGSQAGSASAGRNDQSLIHFHYDLSNNFYAQFLDPHMVYSCAYFDGPQTGLEEAQANKLDMICRKLHLQKDDRLFDPGCGWGALICYAAEKYGVKSHGVTLAQEQFDYCKQLIASKGLQDRVTVEFRDYRSVDTPESFDKVAQIEMFEHVGLENQEAHFLHMYKLLRPRGIYLHQASTRRATPNLADFAKPTAYQKFATRYIFPGGALDHIGMTVTNLERLGFEVHDVEAMREHFQRTLELWAGRLWTNRAAAVAEVGEARTRMWLFYLAASSIAFKRSTLNVFQTVASKRRVGPSGLPFSRRGLYDA